MGVRLSDLERFLVRSETFISEHFQTYSVPFDTKYILWKITESSMALLQMTLFGPDPVLDYYSVYMMSISHFGFPSDMTQNVAQNARKWTFQTWPESHPNMKVQLRRTKKLEHSEKRLNFFWIILTKSLILEGFSKPLKIWPRSYMYDWDISTMMGIQTRT